MLNVTNSLPLYFGLLWGIFGTLYILRWVIKSTKRDPILWRIGWIMGAVLNVVATTDQLVKGKVISLEWWSITDWLSIPWIIITVIMIYAGGYQKAMRPDFDQGKRKIIILCSYVLVITFIFLGLLFAGFYIHDNFFRK